MPNEVLPWWLRRVARQLSHFEVLALDANPLDALLSDDDVSADLRLDGTKGGRFLEQHAARELHAALAEEGTLDRLRERGFDPVLSFRQDEAGRHILRITDGQAGPAVVEAVARFVQVLYRAAERHAHPERPLEVIVLDWLLLQDPHALFTADRPPLPGQLHPGLGASRRALDLLDTLARRLQREAVLAFPSHYHNAVLTNPAFRFIDPVRQGELLALERDLAGLTLAEQSWAVELGLVTEAGGALYQWSAEEMAHPTGPRVDGYLAGKAYEAEVRAATDRLAFEVDHAAARAKARAILDNKGRRPNV